MCGPRSRWTRRRVPIGRGRHVARQSCELTGSSLLVLTVRGKNAARPLDAPTASELWMKPPRNTEGQKGQDCPKGSGSKLHFLNQWLLLHRFAFVKAAALRNATLFIALFELKMKVRCMFKIISTLRWEIELKLFIFRVFPGRSYSCPLWERFIEHAHDSKQFQRLLFFSRSDDIMTEQEV